MIPNTSNIFIRYFTEIEGEEIDEIFISISDLDSSGVPIDDNGDDKDSDGYLYVLDGDNYVQVVDFQIRKDS